MVARLMVTGLVIQALVWWGMSLHRGRKPDADTARPVPAPLAEWPAAHPIRPVFRHSIVHGGVYSEEEFEEAKREDQVVAAHYAVFRGRVRAQQLQHDVTAYVSYRIKDAVFWTGKPVTLRKGETVITDGVHMIRGRCGNRVAETPQQPVALAEPPEVEMETPLSPPHPLGLIPDLPGPPELEVLPELPPDVPPPAPPPPVPPEVPPPTPWIPPPPIPYFPPGPPDITTPEPASWWLLGVGVAVLAAARRLRWRRD